MPSGCGPSSSVSRVVTAAPGAQRVQLAAATHATWHAVRHDQRHAPASPCEVIAEPGGRNDGPTGQVELGKPPATQLLPVVVVEAGTAEGAARRPEGGSACHQHGGEKIDGGLPPGGAEPSVIRLDQPDPPLTAEGHPAGALGRRARGESGDEAEGLLCGARVEALA